MKPSFSFTANLDGPDDKSGTAKWSYFTTKRGEEKEVIVRQAFDTFLAANGINDMLIAVWEDGVRAGQNRVCNAVESSMIEFCR